MYLTMFNCSDNKAFNWCVYSINCSGHNMSDKLLRALGEADANEFICSKELRPCKYTLFFVAMVL